MPDEPQAKRICLFGGTFDPIHLAHLRIANEALKTFALDQVLFIPGANPPHKASETVTPYEDRFHMVEIACAPYSSFVPSRLESGPELSYTIDTLDRVRSQLTPGDSLYFLIGSDAFDELQTWMRWEDVVKLTDFIVVSRPGRQYQIPDGARVHRLDGLELPISSSEVRARLSRGESPAEVPAEVREYINQRGLYGRNPARPV